MYKVCKDMGATENVFLKNTDTMAEINLGRVTPTLCRILEKDGYDFSDPGIIRTEWDFKVSSEVKDELRKLAMPMKKPIRDQRKVKTEEKKEIVDVLDIIYGLA